VTNTTFIFETFPYTKPKKKKVGKILCPPRLKKLGVYVPRFPHQIAPMITKQTYPAT